MRALMTRLIAYFKVLYMAGIVALGLGAAPQYMRPIYIVVIVTAIVMYMRYYNEHSNTVQRPSYSEVGLI